MKRRFMKQAAMAVLAALGAWIMAAHPVWAEKGWRQLDKADFPAHVRAVVFSKGTVFDAERTVTWGKWTASFGGPKAVAERFWDDVGGGSIHVFLKCQNPVVGIADCHFLLFQKQPPSGTGCFLVAPGTISLNIGCPVEMRFE